MKGQKANFEFLFKTSPGAQPFKDHFHVKGYAPRLVLKQR